MVSMIFKVFLCLALAMQPTSKSLSTDFYYGLAETGQPLIVTLVDTVAAELSETIQNVNSVDSQINFNNLSQIKDIANKTPTVVDLPIVENITDEKQESQPVIESPIVVDNDTVLESSENVKSAENETVALDRTSFQEPVEVENETLPEEIEKKTAQEDIPSFSEWAQKQLEEAEKNKENGLNLSVLSVTSTVSSPSNIKVRSKNYASPDCGAKIVATNPESGSASFILNPNRDEYMLNTCNSRIWFIVELCEAIQAKKIDIANFELFSSTPKNFSVSVGDRFPTREWANVGQFEAKDERDVQTFNLQSQLFGKFIKVELHSHHGSEHYCPISLFRVYGTSEFEVFETENSPDSQDTQNAINDEDDILEQVLSTTKEIQDTTNNLFGSARDAVMSIVKKAAQVLVKSGDSKNSTSSTELSESTFGKCMTPSHIIVCDSCTNALFSNVYEIISCESKLIEELLKVPSIHNAFYNTDICQQFGLDFKSTQTSVYDSEIVTYMSAFIRPTYVVALCNMLAIIEKKVVLNTSYDTDLNITSNLTIDKKTQAIKSEEDIIKNIVQISSSTEDTPSKVEEVKETTTNQSKEREIITNTIAVEDMGEISRIKPTKTIDEGAKLTEPSVILSTTSRENPTVNNVQTTQEPKLPDIQSNINIESNSIDDPINLDANKSIQTPEEEALLNLNQKNTENNVVENVNNVINLTDDSLEKLFPPDFDNLLSELEQVNNDAATPAPIPNIGSQASQGQKESVFLRLSNRIKSLERNMSLSSQYLEELSRRYKKQVEEMQKTFDKTLVIVKEESKRAEERDHKNKEEMLILQQQLAELSSAVSLLLSERNSWLGTLSFLNIFLFQVVITFVIFYFYQKINRPREVSPERRVVIKDERVRRNSTDCKPELTSALKNHRRRSSDEAMQIVRACGDIADNISVKSEKKKRRRKSNVIQRSYSIAAPSDLIDLTTCTSTPIEKTDFIKSENGQPITDTPFVLEESEFIIPEGQPLNFDKLVSKKSPVNGSAIKQETSNKNSDKFRRLSSPAFLRGSFSRQSTNSNSFTETKSLPSSGFSTPIKNMFVKRNIKSEEKAERSESESPQPSVSSSVSEISEDKKFNKRPKGKTFKTILKNVLNK